ncbi:EAL domain-containing protein [Cohnella pontilimi]|uniref:EAL domain-containing protein n=1 Tax=Cohnella pontilimi TaxID=2564100 RepID=A0A4U0FAS2_9BACL|nr:EAL domain-containing protein [Cohnella pontilimi]TJY41845.1 EAL domain-containing protein [Cohnella pontilimi]
MGKRYRIGVIATHMDGEYYGRLLTHLHKILREKECQLIAIQAADDDSGIRALEHAIAIDIIDAWILILPSSRPAFVDELFESGKPIVCVGFQSPDDEVGSILVDNRNGMKDAVLHLIDHGHRQIAYVGHMDEYDLRQRFAGYCDALEERGIVLDDRLVISARDNLLEAGAEAARRLIESGVAFTAVAAGTDFTAFGVIDTLREHGRMTPDDVAVVGFDDTYDADTFDPPLTTVRQSHEALAQEACRILIDRLSGGRESPHRTSFVPVQLIARQSCGCKKALVLSSEEMLSLRQTLSNLRSTLQRVTINSIEMTEGLIKATEDTSVHISDLFWSQYHWGCLALWEPDEFGRRQLVVRQIFSRRGDPLPPIGQAFPLKQFPPVDFLPPTAEFGGEDIVLLHPVKTEMHDWGIMTLAGPYDPVNEWVADDLSMQSFTILAVTLEREALFKRNRAMADKLEIVLRTTSDGIWEWDLEKNRMEWNIGANSVMSRVAESLTDNPLSLLTLVHPADVKKVEKAFAFPLPEGRRITVEFRIRSHEERDIWVFGAGEVIRDSSGSPVKIIGSVADITEKKESEARIIELAYHDALTGLPNRVLFQERLEKALERVQRRPGKLAVFMIDLDRFKFVNDTLGHQAGDKLLQQVADRLRVVVAEKGTIARLGGDEFIVLLPRLNREEEATELAASLLRNLDRPFELEGQQIYVAASVGTSLYPDHGADSDTLIRYADLAMYHAKENGGNGLELYMPSLGSRNDERFTMETGLRRALDRGEFSLLFQPQFHLATGELYGAEALLRWETPEGRQIPPCEFIPLAEETGLIIPIGQWVLEQACLACKRWYDNGHTSLIVSVNISALQFQSDLFPDAVRQVLRQTGTDPTRLCLEITEYTAVQNLERSIRILKELAGIGVKFAIDDFGTGQSQLVLLRKFPAHHIKIDTTFIRDMMEQPDDEAIVRAVIGLSHSLGLTVTAEGVETEGQMHKLRQMNCDRIQGYYTGRPMTSSQFKAWTKRLNLAPQ